MPNLTMPTGSTKRFSEVDFENDDDARAFVEQCCADKREYNDLFERDVMFNKAWYMGLQNLLVGESGRLERFEYEPGHPSLVFNKIQPLVDSRVAKIAFEAVTFELWPETDSVKSLDAARVGSKVLKYYGDLLCMPSKEEAVDREAVLAGESYVKVTWDAYAGSEMDPLAEVGLESKAEYKRVFNEELPDSLTQGELVVDIVEPINIFWGPRGTAFEDAEWILEVNERSRSYVRERYELDDEDMAEIGEDDDEALVYRTSEIGPQGIRGTRERNSDTLVVKELWIHRCQKYPNGWRVITAGKKTLKNDANPYNHRDKPYARFRDMVIHGRERGFSIVTTLRGPQSEYNANINQQAMNRHLMANPRIWARKGSVTNYDEVNSRPGGIAEFVSDSPPMLMQGAAMPNSCLQQLNFTEKAMQDIAGIHDVSQAKVPAGMKAARAIALMQEADNERLAQHARRRRESWERVGRLMLATLNQFVREDRVGKILGEDGRWETFKFTGGQLLGPDGSGAALSRWDVRVQTTGRARSRAAQNEDISMLAQSQFLTPADPNDKKLVLKALDLGEKQGLNPRSADINRARRENELMLHGEGEPQQIVDPATGQPIMVVVPPVRDYDDDVAHQEEHNWRRKQEDFRTLPMEVQTAFQIHDQMHEENKVKKALRPQLTMQKVMTDMGLAPQPQPGGPGQSANAPGQPAAPGQSQ